MPIFNNAGVASGRGFGVNSTPPQDLYFKNVTTLLHGDGANGAQNDTFLDSSSNSALITRNGAPVQGTFSPYGNNWSVYFNGSTDYLTTPNNLAIQMAGKDFTIECWFYVTALGAERQIVNTADAASSNYSYAIIVTAAGAVQYFLSNTGTTWNIANAVSAGTVVANSWNHIALVRSINTVTPYLNGVSGTTLSIVGGLFDFTSALRVGAWGNGTNPFLGYISNLRIVKNTAVYTANFTPPFVPLTAITNTSLLICKTSYFDDQSSNNFTVTGNGSPSVQRYSPFSPVSEYTTSVIGGGGYFNGTSDYLSTQSSPGFSFGTSDFTVEFWVHYPPISNTNGKMVLDSRPTSTNGSYWIFGASNTGIMAFTSMTTGGTTVSDTIARPNQWVHYAATRSNTTLRLFANGVQVASATDASNISSSTLRIGTNAFASSATDTYWLGYISDVRIVKGVALYTSAFAPPTAPLSNISNTQLLLSFTNSGVYDNAMMTALDTAGSTQISTTSPKFGTGSILFNGSSDYITSPFIQNYSFGTGDFTIEFWVNFTATANRQDLIWINISSGDRGGILYNFSANSLTYYISPTVAAAITAPFTPSAGVWYHIALTRASGSSRLFIDGVQGGSTYADTKNYAGSYQLFLGRDSFVSSSFLNGKLDDVRITRGVARYTANFTPPAASFPNQ